MASSQRTSAYTQASGGTGDDRPKSLDTKNNIWSSMLNSVSSGKKLPAKNILVLGGTMESQKEFLEGLAVDDSRKLQERYNSKKPPIANNFALGYTYQDVLDADHEDILARISIYLLADPSPSLTPLLQPLLTPATIDNTLVVILLDWSEPWFWLRELQNWIRLLRTLFSSLEGDCKEKMEAVMLSWRDRGRGAHSLDGGGSSGTNEGDVSLPLGPGEWEEALGLPLCVVCQSSDKIETLEKEHAWREEEFDIVLQFMRTVLLKHGASLIYTIPSVTSPLQSLIHSSLGIHSLLKKQPLKHNVIDRDKVVVPPNWDSWGKIRVLREGFDVEAVNKGWSLDIEESYHPPPTASSDSDVLPSIETPAAMSGSAVQMYEEIIQNPALDVPSTTNETKLEVQSLSPQIFLASQFEILEKLKNDKSDVEAVLPYRTTAGMLVFKEGEPDEEKKVVDHIGPVQFNMGGIQVDADDMLQRLKDRQTYGTPEPTTPSSASNASMVGPEGKSQNEALASFFAGLMKRGGGSANISPKPGP
ncbi:dynein light intermediate chain-domain-containing protein [Calycina marina]|uniref:Dynein light intermediate chain-domain-containing protein n=1 Tax=Calycina marina TaxID=1763456 RepID=A0A9P8CEZ7_9HELO|nr:dynein light intermediate chain-domain-containing protein [Calycina marina]